MLLSLEVLRHRNNIDGRFCQGPAILPYPVCLGEVRKPADTFDRSVGIFERQLQILRLLVGLVVPMEAQVDTGAGDIGLSVFGITFFRLCTIGKALGLLQEPLILTSLCSLIVYIMKPERIGRTCVVSIEEHRWGRAQAWAWIVVASRLHAVPVGLISGETESKIEVGPMSCQDSES